MNTVLGIIGAAAWVPHVLTWLHRWFGRPRLRFVPQDIVEIGYTSFGPLLNETFAIRTSGKDALIEQVKVTVIHESGEQHDFYWRLLSEIGPEMTTTSGNIAEFRKTQPAIAVTVSVVGLTERKILFQDTDYQKRFVSLFREYKEKETHLERTEGQSYKQKAIKTQEFLKVLDLIKRRFYWKEGKYDVVLHARESSLKTPHIENFGFELSGRDIEQLEKNIAEAQKVIVDSVIYKDAKPEEAPKYFWNWVYPSFHRK